MNSNIISVMINHLLLPRGKYVEHFDAEKNNLAPGVYYFQLVRDEKSMVRKMVVN